MDINFKPVAFVRNSRKNPDDDYWGSIISEIELAEHIPDEAILGISQFSHLEIIFYFDRADADDMSYAINPRGNPDFPVVGIFAMRRKDRPNAIGLASVELLEQKGRTLKVKYLDAIDGTPVLDIKPVFREFRIDKQIRQPEWVSVMLKDYWK